MAQDETLRQRIISELSEAQEPVSLRELSQLVHASEKDLISHLPHVERSLKKSSKVLIRVPAACRNCGFEFTGRKDFKKPSRCPDCRSESISPPQFRITS
ncbi:MAG: hypothetical protein V5B78_06200 [Desulfohalobiaceae bacterium]